MVYRDLEEQYARLSFKKDNLVAASIDLTGYFYIKNQDEIADGIDKVILEIEKELLKIKLKMLIVSIIEDEPKEKLEEYIETLEKVISII